MTSGEQENQEARLIASLTIFPVGIGTSLGDYVRKAHSAIKDVEGIEVEATPMATIVEAPSLDKVLEAVRAGHSAMLEAKAPRIHIALTVDDRRDRPPSSRRYKVERMIGNT